MIKNIILLILSLIIYTYLGSISTLFIIFSIITSYLTALLNKKNHKTPVYLCIFVNILILIIIRITNNFHSIIVPLGISYYTLQIISYTIDVYKKKIEAEKNIILYALYITYIPHLFIGPISKYQTMKNNFNKPFKLTTHNITSGLLRICLGLFKKFIIAARISVIISTITSDITVYTGSYVLLATILYSFLIYNDFSGGIDIVIGISKIIDFDLEENFNNPYFSETIKEFWHKWHITLSTWLKEYIYIPLGGNRVKPIRKYLNIIITFIISGLWHGFNFIIWGLLNGILVCFGSVFKTKYKPLNYLKTFLIISLLWIFFIYENPLNALKMLSTIITDFNPTILKNIFNLGLDYIEWIILIIFIILITLYDIFKEFINNKIINSSTELKVSLICTSIIIILLLGYYGIGFNIENFIYSKF